MSCFFKIKNNLFIEAMKMKDNENQDLEKAENWLDEYFSELEKRSGVKIIKKAN